MTSETKAPAMPLPDVSRPAWEARFGKPKTPQLSLTASLPNAHVLPDVSKGAWEARFGKSKREVQP